MAGKLAAVMRDLETMTHINVAVKFIDELTHAESIIETFNRCHNKECCICEHELRGINITNEFGRTTIVVCAADPVSRNRVLCVLLSLDEILEIKFKTKQFPNAAWIHKKKTGEWLKKP